MPVTITPIRADHLAEYASVPMVIDVRSRLILTDFEDRLPTLPGPALREELIATPYRKDYDAYYDGSPIHWPSHFDLSHWAFWLARDGGQVVGAAAVALRTPGLWILKGSDDLAALWDIRVHRAHQRKGIGRALLQHAARWAASQGCTALKIETQNVNVPANRFYAAQDCRLTQIVRNAYCSYPALAHEVMLIWELRL